MKKIRCGVLGAGWWGTFAHIPALLEHPEAELVAIQHHDPEIAKKIALDFSVPIACTSAEELLAVDGLEAVAISSAPFLHYRQTLAALTAGKHVLVEKPMSFTAREARELVDTATARNLQFLISCPWHYTRHGQEAKRLIAEGALGEIRMISMLMTNPVDHLLRGAGTSPTYGTPYIHPAASTYSDPKVSGGGQIYAQVSHAAAYLSFLTGAQPVRVFARFHNDGEAVDLYDTLNIRMDDGSMATIASTGVTNLNRRDFEVRVFGTRGILYLELWRGTMEMIPIQGEARRFADLEPDETYPQKAPAQNLIDSVLSPARNGSPATLGLAAMQVIEGAWKSAEQQTDISIASLMGSKPDGREALNP